MPQSKPRRRTGHGEIVPPLSKLDRIGELLQIQLETFPQKELTPAEIARWEQDLSGFSLEAIEFAFDTHRQLAMFFPVPFQIIDICKTFVPPKAFAQGCNAECRDRHGKGYGENDILYLVREHAKKRAQVNRKLTTSEWGVIYDSLDKLRGGSPEWRA